MTCGAVTPEPFRGLASGQDFCAPGVGAKGQGTRVWYLPFGASVASLAPLAGAPPRALGGPSPRAPSGEGRHQEDPLLPRRCPCQEPCPPHGPSPHRLPRPTTCPLGTEGPGPAAPTGRANPTSATRPDCAHGREALLGPGAAPLSMFPHLAAEHETQSIGRCRAQHGPATSEGPLTAAEAPLAKDR